MGKGKAVFSSVPEIAFLDFQGATNLFNAHGELFQATRHSAFYPFHLEASIQSEKPHHIFLGLNHLLLIDNDRAEGEGTS